MIADLKALLRVKELKEEQAFRAVNIKRLEVASALTVLHTAREKFQHSVATFSQREDLIYRDIMQRVIDFDKLEETKGRIEVLEKAHAKLADGVERATLVHERLEKQLAQAVAAYNTAVKNRDKYSILTEEIGAELQSQIVHREESEVEDLFSTRVRRST